MGALATVLVSGDRRLGVRLRSLMTQVLRSPVRQFRLGNLRRWSERGIIALVMQTADNSLTLSLRRRFGRLVMTSAQGHGEPNPSYLPQAHSAAAAIAARVEQEGGEPAEARGSWPEVFGIPLTAHFLGGAVISAAPEDGVVDPYHRVWGYPGLHVVDGSAVPGEPRREPVAHDHRSGPNGLCRTGRVAAKRTPARRRRRLPPETTKGPHLPMRPLRG